MESSDFDQRFYPIARKLSGEVRYMIYAMGDDDYLISDAHQFLMFNDMQDLKSYAAAQKVEIDETEGTVEFDFDFLSEFIASPAPPGSSDASAELMNLWNFFDDMGEFEMPSWTAYRQASEAVNHLHEKLMLGSDMFGEPKVQQWDGDEIEQLGSALSLGLAHFNAATKLYESS